MKLSRGSSEAPRAAWVMQEWWYYTILLRTTLDRGGGTGTITTAYQRKRNNNKDSEGSDINHQKRPDKSWIGSSPKHKSKLKIKGGTGNETVNNSKRVSRITTGRGRSTTKGTLKSALNVITIIKYSRCGMTVNMDDNEGSTSLWTGLGTTCDTLREIIVKSSTKKGIIFSPLLKDK